MNRKTKNTVLGTIIITCTILICVFMYFFGKQFNKHYDNITFIDIQQLKEKINNKDSFVLVFMRTGCSHCEEFLPNIDKIAKNNNITIYSINLSDVETDEDKNDLRDIATVSGTPTTIFIKNGIEVSTTTRLIGNVKEYKILDKLRSEGYIND